jgi:hypothetical protein
MCGSGAVAPGEPAAYSDPECILTGVPKKWVKVLIRPPQGLPQLVNKEGKELVKRNFTATSKASTFDTKSGEKVTCKEDKGAGEVTGPKADRATITFTGCEAFGLKCNSKGAKAGEIALEVTSELVYINGGKHEVGDILTLKSELTIECTAFQKLKIKGAVLCPITPVNTKTGTLTLTHKATKGVQEPTEYEMKKAKNSKRRLLKPRVKASNRLHLNSPV